MSNSDAGPRINTNLFDANTTNIVRTDFLSNDAVRKDFTAETTQFSTLKRAKNQHSLRLDPEKRRLALHKDNIKCT